MSKGIHHEKIELPGNMTGSKYLNQMKIMPRVDMVIHHGGNNSFIETLYFGKPFIVMPLFGDQHDNGRRAIDKKIGKCFLPYRVSETDLLEGIDEILGDTELIERVKLIGQHLRATKSHDILNVKLVEIVNDHKLSNSGNNNDEDGTPTIKETSNIKSDRLSPVWNEPSILIKS